MSFVKLGKKRKRDSTSDTTEEERMKKKRLTFKERFRIMKEQLAKERKIREKKKQTLINQIIKEQDDDNVIQKRCANYIDFRTCTTNLSRCTICYLLFCDRCVGKCSCCKEIYCKYYDRYTNKDRCMHFCDICEENAICSSCLHECEFCSAINCFDCVEQCYGYLEDGGDIIYMCATCHKLESDRTECKECEEYFYKQEKLEAERKENN